ncbi:cyclic-phosphate processing receiver domain-containing protein [Leeuwenhoekiella sp. NPDC079379]|uniref:cyclic-phosphate processing receiver domain-containing protein n=1 Tax=Leeuwenhoekiella sp. NPDC079379 TaxID=3364122 RepID=UPI0037C6BD3A
MYQLFLDDIRTPEMVYEPNTAKTFIVVRSFEAFKNYIQNKGLPEYISFDNDLGLDDNGNLAPDGLAAAKWLVYESGLDLKNLEFYVHSANPVAAEQIRGLLTNYIAFLKRN